MTAAEGLARGRPMLARESPESSGFRADTGNGLTSLVRGGPLLGRELKGPERARGCQFSNALDFMALRSVVAPLLPRSPLSLLGEIRAKTLRGNVRVRGSTARRPCFLIVGSN
jgi:hypothetical protein